MDVTDLIIHTDGGSRGNPGPAACAFAVEQGQNVIHKGSKYLGITTNNQAEYWGVITALMWISENEKNITTKKILFLMDSELVCKQINGIYKIKNPEIKTLFDKYLNNKFNIKIKLEFKSIPREENKLADLLVNNELDKNH